MTLVISCAGAATAWGDDPFGCKHSHCNLQGDGTYPNVVVGIIRRIGHDQDSQQVFRWARHQEWWKPLPDDASAFASHVRPILLQTQGPHGHTSFTGLMGEDEFDTAPLNEGDLVRYSPHDAQHPSPAENTPAAWAYWRLVGCIQVLCRAGDKACIKPYRLGSYQHDTGKEVNLATGHVLTHGAVINPVNYRVLSNNTN
ncbi:MAG: hypothetical protein HKM02_08635 [Pseudomonadales bacterium]|nr:hypothetical protein [Pseudomonadales bacterium]